MEPEEWFECICEVVEGNRHCSIEYPNNKDAEEFVIVSFNNSRVNTHIISNNLPKEALRHTSVGIEPSTKNAKFRWKSEKRKGEVRGTEIISLILEEDLPEREEFEPEYEIYSDKIVVEAPILLYIGLFRNISVNYWVLTDVWERESAVKYTFHQFEKSSEKIPSTEESLATNRVREIISESKFSCGFCGQKQVKFRPKVGDTKIWVWKCDNCGFSIDDDISIGDLTDLADASSSREDIVDTITWYYEEQSKENRNTQLK